MPEIIKVVLLALVEGITEFLPISSTGHLLVVSAILQFQSAGNEGTFEIFIQIGAVVAVLLYYRATFLTHARQIVSNREIQNFWLYVFIAFLPAAVLGFLFHDKIKEILFSPLVVAISLIVGGIAFILVERLPQFKASNEDKEVPVTSITLRQAMIVGLVQVLALVPGVSRSGASILGGMFSGLNRRTATEFSFFLAVPTLGIATLYELVQSLNTLQGNDIINLIIGAVLSGIFAWLAIDWLLSYISHNNFVAFGYYRIFAGLLVLALIAAQIIA